MLDPPLGGGLMSASPCWLELSDCPDSAKPTEREREKEEGEKREQIKHGTAGFSPKVPESISRCRTFYIFSASTYSM